MSALLGICKLHEGVIILLFIAIEFLLGGGSTYTSGVPW
jgi:hypothetical protein